MALECEQTAAETRPAAEAPPSAAEEELGENEEMEQGSVCPEEESSSVGSVAEPDKVASTGTSRIWCTWLLIASVLVATSATSFVSNLAMKGVVSQRGGAVMLSALAASGACFGWVCSLVSFIVTGGTSLIGLAVGEGNDLKAGRFARLCAVIALAIGAVGTLVLMLCRDSVLRLFGQEAVAAEAKAHFTVQAASFWISVLSMALNGIMLGFMYVHVSLGITVLTGLISLFLSFPLFLMTDLGLQAFGIGSMAGSAASAALAIIVLKRGPANKKFGLGLGLSGISLVDLQELGRSFSCLAFRSFVAATQPMISTMLAIRMSPVHGAVFDFLTTQSAVVDSIVGGFALGINFMGARLWGGKYYGAFWCVVTRFVVCVCTPLAMSFAALELVRGRGSLGETFASSADRAGFDAVVTGQTFAIYVLVLIARAYYSGIEMALVAMQEVWWVALIQGTSFVAFLVVALSGYAMGDSSTLFLGGLVFWLCRVVGGAWVLLRKMLEHPPEKYKRGSLTDAVLALRQTIDDPFVAKVFGGRQAPGPEERSGADRV